MAMCVFVLVLCRTRIQFRLGVVRRGNQREQCGDKAHGNNVNAEFTTAECPQAFSRQPPPAARPLPPVQARAKMRGARGPLARPACTALPARAQHATLIKMEFC